MVKIRLKRMGRRHHPFYRITVMDIRSPRDGKVVEEVGTYDPMLKDKDNQVQLKEDRIRYWLQQGAQPSETVGDILKNNGIVLN